MAARRARAAARDEQGVATVLFALLLPVLLILGAFVVDIGQGFAVKRDLQAAVDAAALAGAQELPDQAAAEAMANSYSANPAGVNRHQTVAASPAVVTFPPGDKIKVDQRAVVPTFVAGIFGIGDFDVHVTATASAKASTVANTVIYANSTDCGKGVEINGKNISVDGGVRSNGKLVIDGENVDAPYVSGYGAASGSVCNPDVEDEVEVQNDPSEVPWPVYYSFRDDGDGQLGAPMTAFPVNYCTFTAAKFEFSGSGTIPPGVYCAREEFKVSGDNHPAAQITVLAPIIQISGNNNSFSPFDTTRKILFFSTLTAGTSSTPPCRSGTFKIEINGGNMVLNDLLFNPCGEVSVNAYSASALKGFIASKTVKINGDGFNLTGTGPPTAPGGPRTILMVE